MKLLRTIRLDASDSFVFERPAEPGEWAVSGQHARAFEFLEVVGEENAPDEYLDLAALGKGAGA